MNFNMNTNTTIGKKNDEGKNRLDLIEPDFILGVGKVLTYGAEKYGAGNWKNLDDMNDRYYAAAMRHLLAWRSGEETDEETGLSHLYHAACNMMFLTYEEK